MQSIESDMYEFEQNSAHYNVQKVMGIFGFSAAYSSSVFERFGGEPKNPVTDADVLVGFCAKLHEYTIETIGGKRQVETRDYASLAFGYKEEFGCALIKLKGAVRLINSEQDRKWKKYNIELLQRAITARGGVLCKKRVAFPDQPL